MRGFLYRIAIIVMLMGVSAFPVPGAEILPEPRPGARPVPLELYLIVDPRPNAEALSWLCDYLVDRVLQEGDGLTIWTADAAASRIFQGALAGAEGKTRVKALLRGLGTAIPSAPDYAGALWEAALREAARQNAAGAGRDRIVCTVVAAGKAGRPEGEAARLLRFSRLEDFSTFRVFTAALNIEADVRRAAAAFMGRDPRGRAD